MVLKLYSGTPGSGKSLDVARKIYHALRYGRPVIANFDINISLDDVCYDWSKESYFVKPEVEKQIIGSFLNEDERDKDKDVVKYTSLQTLLATLISGKIRINSIVGMNDKTETNFMIDMIKNFREPIEEEGDEYLLANRKFITSFSGKKDDLIIW